MVIQACITHKYTKIQNPKHDLAVGVRIYTCTFFWYSKTVLDAFLTF